MRPAQQPKPAPKPPTRRERAQKFSKEHVPRKPISRNNYQAVILAEFIAAILLTAMTPVATKKDQQGLSPYAGSDIVKLGAITLLYLILAMISVGGPQAGRLAAWLGGLVLLTDGLFEASNIVKDLQAFSGGGSDVTKPKPKAKAA